jgi:hypothetical protein
MEIESFSESSGQTVILATDHFDWSPDLPADFFVPQIPPGFAELDD